MYKKKNDARAKLLFCLVKLLLFSHFLSPLHLKLPVIYGTLWSVRNRIFSVQIELLLLIESGTFFDSSVMSSFVSGYTKLGERTGQLWRHNIRRVQTHEKNSKETVRRLGTIIQSIFVPNQKPAFAWPFENGPVRVVPRGSSAHDWKLSTRLFSRPHRLPLGLRGCMFLHYLYILQHLVTYPSMKFW